MTDVFKLFFFQPSGRDDHEFYELVCWDIKMLMRLYYCLGEQGRTSPDLQETNILSGQRIQR